MKQSLAKGFNAGALGAIILVGVMYVLKGAGMGDPGFVGIYRAAIGSHPPTDAFIASILFIISGGVWGIIFLAIVKNPSILKGILFGILPTLWLWVAVNGIIGKPLFNDFKLMGLIMPVFFNMIIWGSFIGWYTSKKIKSGDQ